MGIFTSNFCQRWPSDCNSALSTEKDMERLVTLTLECLKERDPDQRQDFLQFQFLPYVFPFFFLSLFFLTGAPLRSGLQW